MTAQHLDGGGAAVRVPVQGRPPIRVVASLAAAGAVFGAAVLMASASGRHETSTTTLFSGMVGGLYLTAGVIASVRQPANRVGLLMVLVGIAWFAEDMQVSIDPVTHTAGLFVRSASTALLVHLVLAFPSGQLRSRVDRVLVTIAYVTVFGLIPLSTPFFRTYTKNLLLIRYEEWLPGSVNVVQVAVATAVVAVLLVRWITSTRPARRVLAPVFVTGLLGAVESVVGPVLGEGVPWAHEVLSDIGHLAVLLLPLAFLAGVWRVRLGRTTVADLLVRLPRASPTELQDLLATALGDPSLRVGYYRADHADYVDREGRPLVIPSYQAVTVVERDGRRVAALVHDPALRDDRHVLEAVTSAAALELDNQRLAAEVRAQLVEVRASRARIVAAGDDQRRRVERDLHDGAQQQLVTVALLLRLAQQQLDSSPDRDAKLADYLRRSAAGLEDALRELRELARGIHPAVLSEAGLLAALRALAARSPRPIELREVPLPALPAPVEATAYFVAAEAVTNALKYASARTIRIEVRHDKDELHLEVTDDGVGGADLTRGTGLLGLRDRASALDGELVVRSSTGAGTSVHVVLPLEPA
ncbi:ATP-binding protein [Actinocrispum sp. NPDC049592]|uniref:sensor histidine kinase n=1 Tax=Actinocrispum sp. NPDC049592 TaxID=3154835 RepID=UPI003436D04B